MAKAITRSCFLSGQSNAVMYEPAALTWSGLVGYASWVVSAAGGQGLANWLKGNAQYALLLDAILANPTSEARVVWWIQGETDAANGEHALYASRMLQFAADLEADVGRPIWWVDCQLHDNLSVGTAPTRQAVRDAKTLFASTYPQRVVLTQTTGIALEADNIHWTATSRLVMADRMWDAARSLSVL